MDSYEVLHFIERDIEKKYGIKDARLKIEGEIVVDYQEIIDWIDENSWNEDGVCWVKYIHISDDLFELKRFSPRPPVSICKKIAQDFINSAKGKTITPFFKIGEEIYDEKKASTILLRGLKRGYSRIGHFENFFPDPEVDGNRKIYHVYFSEDSLYEEMKSGYRVLEDTTKD